MKYITRNIESAFSKRDLEAILMNRDGKNQAVISDLDGTIHKGLYYSKLHGASHADLSILLALSLDAFRQIPKFVMSNIKIYRDYKRMNKEGQDQSDIEEQLIKEYCNEALVGLNVYDVITVARSLPRFAFRKSKEALAELSQKSELTIISKSIEPVLFAYRKAFSKLVSEISFKCNYLHTEGKIIQGLLERHAILAGPDKFSAAREALQNKNQAAIFGNSSEDTAMFAAAEIMSIPNVTIAVHPRDDHIARTADVIMNSWTELYTEVLHQR